MTFSLSPSPHIPPYAALIVHADGALSAFGPCQDELDAELIAVTLQPREGLLAAGALPLIRPRRNVIATIRGAHPGAVTAVPALPASRVAAHHREHLAPDQDLLPSHDGPRVVWLQVTRRNESKGMLVGPFPTADDADAWTASTGVSALTSTPDASSPACQDAGPPSTTVLARALALRSPQDAVTSSTPTEEPAQRSGGPGSTADLCDTGQPPASAVIVADLVAHGTLVLGPFRSTAAAIAGWRDLIARTSLTNPRAVHFLRVDLPHPASRHPAPGPSTADEPPPHLVLVRRPNSMTAIGWFTHREEAVAWLRANPQGPTAAPAVYQVHRP
jgi:hypothetical protein